MRLVEAYAVEWAAKEVGFADQRLVVCEVDALAFAS